MVAMKKLNLCVVVLLLGLEAATAFSQKTAPTKKSKFAMPAANNKRLAFGKFAMLAKKHLATSTFAAAAKGSNKQATSTHFFQRAMKELAKRRLDAHGNATTTAAAAEPATTAATTGLPNLLQLAKDNGFNTLVAAVTAADLGGALEGEGPLTIMAPNDAAFAACFDALKITADEALASPQLPAILTYHAVPSKVMAADVTDGMEVTTVQGESFTVNLGESGPTITGGSILPVANVIATDVEASNGVAHVIDQVLIPPTISEELMSGGGDDDMAGCMKKCPGLQAGYEAVTKLGEDPPMDKVVETLMPEHEEAMKCIMDSPEECKGALETIEMVMCAHECPDFLTVASAFESGMDEKSLAAGCPYVEATATCLAETSACKKMAAGMGEMIKPIKMMCLLEKKGCPVDMEGEGPGSLEKCMEEHGAGKGEECNNAIMAKEKMPDDCCEVPKKIGECMTGGMACYQLSMAMMVSFDESGETGKIIDVWSEECGADVMPTVAGLKELADEPIVDPAPAPAEGAVDLASPRSVAAAGALLAAAAGMAW